MDWHGHPGATVDADRLIGLRALAQSSLPRLAETGRPGSHAGRKRGSGLDIRDIRPYADGDDFRHMDAMATARTGKPHVRTFHEDQDRTAMLVVDFRHTMLWGTRGRLRSVLAAELAALAGWRMLSAGGRVGMLAFSDRDSVFQPPRERDTAMVRIAGSLAQAHRQALDALAAGDRVAGVGLEAHIDRVARLVPRGATVVLATGLDDGEGVAEQAIRPLLRLARVEIFLIRDAFERDPPQRNLPYFSEDGVLRWGAFTKDEKSTENRIRALRDIGATVRVIDSDTVLEEVAEELYADAR
ncbi:DUF58 domain-containing protein [Hwanghaeella sp.]|uniref:DUF58 domain-containing protein n=1 Tax=Hwanghaeella sp. TaxID=2605943 RepID=UPI003CCB8452